MTDEHEQDFHERVRAQADQWLAEMDALRNQPRRGSYLIAWLEARADDPVRIHYCNDEEDLYKIASDVVAHTSRHLIVVALDGERPEPAAVRALRQEHPNAAIHYTPWRH